MSKCHRNPTKLDSTNTTQKYITAFIDLIDRKLYISSFYT